MKILTSGLPLPIGTSHALETYLAPVHPVYDQKRVVPKPPRALENYDVIYINVYTLARNLISASEDFNLEQAAKKLSSDIEWIKGYIKETAWIKVIFYRTIATKHYLVPSTRKRVKGPQSAKAKMAKHNLENLTSLVTAREDLDIVRMADGIRGTQDMTLVYTSVPLDLVLHNQHRELSVLSSHTGAVYDKKDLHKKYFPIPRKNMEVFPFNMHLLRFLGDTVILSPSPIGMRKELYEIALANNWSHRTTLAKVESNLKDESLKLYSEIFKTN